MAQGMVQGVLKQGLKLWIVAGDRVRATVAEARAEYEHRGAGAAHPAAERDAGADLGGAVGAGVGAAVGGPVGAAVGGATGAGVPGSPATDTKGTVVGAATGGAAGAATGGPVGAVIGGTYGAAVAGETLSEEDEEGRTSQGSPPPGSAE